MVRRFINANGGLGGQMRRLAEVLPLLLSLFVGVAFAADPVIIGQSLPLGGADDGSSLRTMAGAQAYVDLVNTSGGIRGRPVRLITLDDGGDPKRHAENMRQLVTQHKAVALLNCLGDASCASAAEVARQYKVALIGPVSGAQSLGRTANPFVFRIRAAYAREADAMARQMLSLGTLNAALITDSRSASQSVQALSQALTQHKIAFKVLPVDPTNSASFGALESEITSARYQVVFLDIRADTLAYLTQLQSKERWPLVIMTFASGNVNALLSGFSNRMLGFTSVVPNPELSALPLARELQLQAERSTGGPAVTFAGMEAYVNTRVCIEALRRADASKTPVDGRSVLAALNTLGVLELGGFSLNFAGFPQSASDSVEIVVRSRTGHLMK